MVARVDPHGVRARRGAAAGRRLLPVRPRGPAPLPAPSSRDARARAERRRGRAGLERGGGDRAHDRHAARARLPAPSGCGSTSSTTRAPTRRPTSCSPRPPSTRAACSTCAASAAARARRTRSTTGCATIRAEGWYEAVLIIDADVIFTARSLRRMVRHLGDPDGRRRHRRTSRRAAGPANFMNRFVSFEYVSAQAGARRAQNVLGAQACLAGGAQLLRRESLEAIGGEIDTSSLAEDTFTTFNVQLAGGPRGLRAARDRLGRGAARHRRPVEAAAALGARQRPGDAALPPLLAAAQRGPARRRQLRADLVLGLPDAGADGALVGRAGHAVPARPRPLDRRLPLAVGAEPRDLPVRDALGFAQDGPAARRELVGGDHVPRA